MIQTNIVKTLNQTIVIFFLASTILCQNRDLYFSRSFVCIDQKKQPCGKWNDTISLSYYRNFWGYGCFSEQEYVLTDEGPKSFKHIQTGDRILGYNLNNDRPEFSQVIAWLHRETDAQLQYEQIISGSLVYSISSSHNVAYLNKSSGNQELTFKLAELLVPGDSLITANNTALKIDHIGNKTFQKGLYSPYTELGNFYIFPKQNKNVDSMILVHCFSQVNNPNQIDNHWFHNLMTSPIVHYLGVNKHTNLENEDYQHPSIHLLKLIDGFHGSSAIIKHEYYYSSTNSNHNNEEHEKRQALSVLFTALRMNEIIFYPQ